MTDKKINRWQDTITPRDKAPQPWTVKSGGSWDMLDVQPIPDEMLAELARDYHRLGTPWNCRSLPLSPNDREYMYLLYYSMQGLVARMRNAERQTDDLSTLVLRLVRALRKSAPDNQLAENAMDYLKRNGLQGSPLRATPADHIVDANKKVDADSVPVAEMPLTSGAGPRKLAWFKHPDSFAPGTKLYAKAPQSEAQSVRDAWISVDERLPEQHEWVLVSDGTWSAIGMHLDDEDLEPNKRWMDESAELIESNGIKITHWMPMPAPPQKPVSDEVKP